MNAGAQANHDKAAEIATTIAVRRSEGLTYSEVASVLGNISPAAVKQRAYRARKYQERHNRED